jgi:hypothetical protein
VLVLGGKLKLTRRLKINSMETSKFSKFQNDFTALLLVLCVAMVFIFTFLPLNFLNPSSYRWIFGSELNMRDDAGHAIASLFYTNIEPWNFPIIGNLSVFGGEPGGSLIYFAVSPLFAIPFKIMGSLFNLPIFQFIGLQAAIGIGLTSVATYPLARRLGSSRLSAIAVSVSALTLPALLSRAFNESLTMQFILIGVMFTALNPKTDLRRILTWIVFVTLAITVNLYFLPMVLCFVLLEAIYLWQILRLPFQKSIKSFFWVCVFSVSLIYVLGGFKLKTSSIRTSSIDIQLFSSNVFTFFDSRGYGLTGDLSTQASWESFNFLGIGVLIPLIFLLVVNFTDYLKNRSIGGDDCVKEKSTGPLFRRFISTPLRTTILGAILLFIISLGTTLQITKSLFLKIPYPDIVIEVISSFRAVGRFSWALLYLLLGIAALGIDKLILTLSRRFSWKHVKVITSLVVVITLVGSQFTDMSKFRSALHFELLKGVADQPRFDPEIMKQFSQVKKFEVIPAYDGDVNEMPWRQLSEYAILNEVRLDSWGFFGRFDSKLAGKIQLESVDAFLSCNWKEPTLALIRTSYINQSKCQNRITPLKTYSPTWQLVKLSND